jgi:hypothetical protein
MILYKFMSLTPFERVADALLGRRLYCPKPRELNDPLEGMLGNYAEGAEAGKPFEEQFKAAFKNMFETDQDLERARVCCFSEFPDSMQMWAYYTGGHKGICLEVDVSEFASNITKVKYIDDTEQLRQIRPVDRLPYKHKSWEHEQEFRLITIDEPTREWLPIDIKTVIISASIESSFMLPIFELCRHLTLPIEVASFSTRGKLTRFPLNSSVPFHSWLA